MYGDQVAGTYFTKRQRFRVIAGADHTLDHVFLGKKADDSIITRHQDRAKVPPRHECRGVLYANAVFQCFERIVNQFINATGHGYFHSIEGIGNTVTTLEALQISNHSTGREDKLQVEEHQRDARRFAAYNLCL